MTNQQPFSLGRYEVDRQGGRPNRYNNGGQNARLLESKIAIDRPRHEGIIYIDSGDNHNNIFGSSPARPYQKKGSPFFNGQGPQFRGDGKDSTFGKHQRPAHETRPFSTFMPFSIDSHPKALEMDVHIKKKFAEMNPGMSDEGPHMEYIYRCWARTPDRPLSEVHRHHAFQKLLQCGNVDEISAEVFHFLCGIHQCKYGDGYMRDDMSLCDCDGKVSRCFVAAYIELARKLHRTEKKLYEANRVAKNAGGRPYSPNRGKAQPRLALL